VTTFVPAYDDEGQGPAVVMIHSGVCDRAMWEPQAVALAATHRVVRLDLRGFGETPVPPGEFSYADDVLAVLDDGGITSATVVGSSFGGQVALELVATHPERVEALALLCTAYAEAEDGPDVLRFGEEEDRLLEAGDLDGAVELNVTTWLGPEASDEVRDRVRRMQRHAFEVQLAAEELQPEPQPVHANIDVAAIAVPTLVVSGGRDLDHFRRVAEQLAAEIPQATRRHLPWAGHLPSMERPDEVTDLLVDFLTPPTSGSAAG
jgi:pimeloyl-ACP methyl ester carboxylesterase